jgi:Tfp pilus assembly protein PilN
LHLLLERAFSLADLISDKVVGLEIGNKSIAMVGFVKVRGKIKLWLMDKFLVDENCPEPAVALKGTLKLVLDKYPKIGKAEIVAAIPSLTVLFKKNGNQDCGNGKNLPNNANHNREVVIIRDRAAIPDHYCLAAMAKCREIDEWLSALQDASLPLAAITKGVCEWPTAYLTLHPQLLQNNTCWFLVDDARLTITALNQGRCTAIHSLPLPEMSGNCPDDSGVIAKLLDNLPQFPEDDNSIQIARIINRGTSAGANRIADLLRENMPPALDSKNNPQWLETDYVMASGAALSRIFESFSCFDFLPEALQEQCARRNQQNRYRRLAAGAAAVTLLLHLILLLFFLGSQFWKNQWEARRNFIGIKIQKIEQLKKSYADLLTEQERIKGTLAGRTSFGKHLYELGEIMPENAWLSAIRFDRESQGKISADKSLALEGFALEQQSVMTLLSRLEQRYGAAAVSLQSLAQVAKDRIPAASGTGGKDLAYFFIRIKL